MFAMEVSVYIILFSVKASVAYSDLFIGLIILSENLLFP